MYWEIMWKILFILVLVTCLHLVENLENNLTLDKNNDSIPRPDIRIVGGHDTKIEKYPFLVQILVYGRLGCGGSIITHGHILTCAHCLVSADNVKQDPIKTGMTVRSGTPYTGIDGSVFRVVRTYPHPKFKLPSLDNDIAVMFLEQPITFTDKQKAGDLPDSNFKIPEDSYATAVGWGLMTDGHAAHIVQEVSVKVMKQLDCVLRYRASGNEVTNNMLCAGTKGKDACVGDSGGPLVFQNVIIGLTSFGISCGNDFYPGVYTRVSSYESWIKQQVRVHLWSIF